MYISEAIRRCKGLCTFTVFNLQSCHITASHTGVHCSQFSLFYFSDFLKKKVYCHIYENLDSTYYEIIKKKNWNKKNLKKLCVCVCVFAPLHLLRDYLKRNCGILKKKCVSCVCVCVCVCVCTTPLITRLF